MEILAMKAHMYIALYIADGDQHSKNTLIGHYHVTVLS